MYVKTKMSTLWDAVALTSGGSTPSTVTTTYTTYSMPFQGPAGAATALPAQPVSSTTITGILPTQQINVQGKSGYESLLRDASLKALFESIGKVNDASTIETRIADTLGAIRAYSASDSRLVALNNADSALLFFDPKVPFASLSADDRRRIHALLALRRQLYLGLDENARNAYWNQQRKRAAEQLPLNTLLYNIVRSPSQANLDYARRVIDWQYDDAATLQRFIDVLQRVSTTSQSDSSKAAAAALIPYLQVRLRQLGLTVGTDGKCGPTNKNTRCPANQCCLTSGQCAKCDENRAQIRPDFLYNGEGVLPILPATIFGGAAI